MSSTFWTSKSYANVVRESQKRCRIPKRETSSDFTAAVGASTGAFGRICVFVIFVIVRFSVVTSPNVFFLNAATENQKGEVAKKGKKSAPKQGVAAESWNHPGRRDARTPTRLTPPRPVPCRFTPHRVHHDVRRRNPRGDSCPAPRSRRKAVRIRPHTQ